MTVLRATATLGLTALAACGHGPERPARTAPAPSPRAVTTAAVERRDAATGSVPAVVQARERATLAARIPASVVALPYREGDAVPAGAVVVRLDDGALRAALAAAQAGADAAEAERRRATALLGKGAATPREKEQAEAQAAGARAAVQGARDALAYAALRAPFAGRLAARHVNVGDVAAPGLPLVELEGTGGLEVKATVDASLLGALAPGREVGVLVDGQPDALAATVRAVSPAGDPATHRFEVKADLPAAPGLRSGLFARLLVPVPGGEPTLVVPAGALFARGGLTGVFVADGGRARLRWVAPGETRAGESEVRAGLGEGERVVLDPAGLTEGHPIVEAAAAAQGR